MAKYRITKRYGHEQGLSCAFRQHAASDTHCSKIHGYALAFEFVVEGEVLDDRNWLISFGEFKPVKEWLMHQFDHKTVLAEDDPLLDGFMQLALDGGLDLIVLPKVGCEAFAKYAFDNLHKLVWLASDSRATLVEVTVSEHGGNSATYIT